MAKIQTETLVVTFNKLVKDADTDAQGIITAEMLESINAVVEELAGNGIVVEIQVA